MRKNISSVLLLLLMVFNAQSYVVSEEVINRSDGMAERPDWVSDTETTIVTEKGLRFIGLAELDIESRPRRAQKVADANAKAAYTHYVSTKLTSIISVAQSGFGLDADLNTIVQQVSRVSVNKMVIKGRYWERVIEKHKDQNNEESQKGIIRLFSMIEISSDDIKKALRKAIEESEMPSKLKTDLEVLVVQEWSSNF